jgi:hypothetical protein
MTTVIDGTTGSSIAGNSTVVGDLTVNGAIQAGGVTTNIYPIVIDTAVTASGTSVDFTGIPSWVKRITVMLRTVGTNGSSNLLIQLGAGSITSTGYSSAAWSANTQNVASTIGMLQTAQKPSTSVINGLSVITNISGNAWVESHTFGDQSASFFTSVGGGSIGLSGVLDRIRITTVNGTDAFNAGTINILYE